MSEDTGLMDNVSVEDESSATDAQEGMEHQAAEVHERPDWLPEKFFDAKSGAKYEDLAKSYGELEKQFRSGKHKAPEDGNYDISIFKDKGVPDDDAALAAYKSWAKEFGVSQKAFETLAGNILSLAGDKVQAQVRSIEDERKALGPNADAMIRGMADWGRGLVNKGVWSREDFEEFKVFAGTAQGMKAAMKLREAYEGRIPDMKSAPVETALSEEDLQAMVADPRYLKEPSYRVKVEKAFERFYGN